MSLWLRLLGGFRVDRDRYDLRAVRIATSVIDRGMALGMYPEGTRSPGELVPFLDGTAWIALWSGAPIVPCAISGTDRTPEARRPGAVSDRITFAPPFAVRRVDDPAERRTRAAALTAQVRTAIEHRLGRPVVG